ncbi:amino acid adenylation domain-containing protein [Saccharopolyspora indica]|uniref:non-ribosomal peptide synthetase n=1 Tax=Saccharopolyspora indica TaxID=1229659 RepID=UPI0022EB983F|nr:non-ribosomal peptide synthetase [Saccharopolyspora indica]MDA3647986.1 amino acid adenylation domain-containing protein [Saccharopolyspora indica]
MTWRDVLSGVARRRPDATAFTFHPDAGGAPDRLSYGELDRRARAIGAELLAEGLGGKTAVLLFPAGLDYVATFFGCLYAGVLAVPAYPPSRHKRSIDRLTAILADSGAGTALTTARVRDKIGPRLSAVPGLDRLRLLATDEITDDSAAGFAEPELTGDTIAFLQYTSGSTATPRGVVLTNDNLLANTALIAQLFELDEDMRGVSWLPMYHDMGLIGSVMATVRVGGRMALLAPNSFASDPVRWLRLISDERANVSGGPNFAFDLCVDRVTPEQRAELDLSSWRVAFNGAEPIRAQSLDRFAETFAGTGFRAEAFLPCYGLAEGSLVVSAGPVGSGFRTHEAPEGSGAAGEIVASGAMPPQQRVEIVDPDAHEPCADGEVGEIWVSGPSVSQCYWNRPDASAATFGARIAGEDTAAFLRTGDLGFRTGGQLYVTGRRKDLVIIRGRNHYPQDVELTVEKVHEGLKANGGAVFSVQDDAGEERLVVVHELRNDHGVDDLDALARRVQQVVAEQHEVRPQSVVLLRVGGLPRTSSGKVARHAARNGFLADDLLVLARFDEAGTPAPAAPVALPAAPEDAHPEAVAEFLRTVVAELLRTDPAEVPLDQPLLELGLDSLDTVRVQHRVQSWLRVQVVVEEALSATITELAATLAAAPRTADAAEPVADTPADHPLSRNQRAMWFLNQLAPHSAAYNITAAAELHGELDVPALDRALAAVVARHPALRTTFPLVEGEPVQRVHAHLPAACTTHDAREWTGQQLDDGVRDAAYRPFDVAEGPLVRIEVFHRAAAEHRFVISLHHLVTDLWSMEVLLRELDLHYRAELNQSTVELPPVAGYPAAARWQAGALDGGEADRLWEFWRSELAEAPRVLELPVDHPRPPEQRFRGKVRRFTLDAELTARLTDLATTTGSTLYTVLLSAFQVLLSRYTGQRDLLVGSPVHGRNRAEVSDTIGCFVNTAVLRAQLDPAESFTQLLHRAGPRVRAALAHADLPLSQLVERLQVARDPGRQPLVQALFTLQRPTGPQGNALAAFVLGHPGASLEFGGLTLRPVTLDQPNTQMDLALTFAETGGQLGALLQYDTDLFTDATAARFAAHLETFLRAVAEHPDRPLHATDLLSPAERDTALRSWNSTETAYDPSRTVVDRVAEQAARTPDAPAVAYDEQHLTGPDRAAVLGVPTLTYAELDRAANRLAHRLVAEGVGPERVVGVHLPRSLELAVALIAVHRAGGAYLPIDPDLPPERLSGMLADSGAELVLTHSTVDGALDGAPARRIRVDELPEDGPDTAPDVRVHPSNTAYVLYTSGSTGRPKGVQVQHASMVNFLVGMQELLDFQAGQRLLALSTFSFDISVLELFLPLLTGGTSHIAGRSVKADGDQLRLRLESGVVDSVQATPASWQLLCDAGWTGTPGLVVLSGGEALPRKLADRLGGLGGQLWNLYGPTETTVWSAAAAVDPEAGPIPIGSPIANTRIYVLDEQFQPVPEGVAGEVCIGGDGLARGYFGLPGLSAEKFVPDPHGSCPGSRMYRTGDLARVRPGGRIEFLGRADHQVKFHGHRIELGEIEAALGRHPAVRRAVVEVVGERAMVAYVQPRSRASTAAFDRQEANRSLRESLRRCLPSYMVPTHFTWLEEFPLNLSGKLDRKRLPAPEDLGAGQAKEAPATATEKALADIIGDLLGGASVGRRDNLFELGAHSLLVSRLAIRVRESFGVTLPLRRLFEAPTVAGLAELVENSEARSTAAAITKVDRGRYAGATTVQRSDVLRKLQAARALRSRADD